MLRYRSLITGLFSFAVFAAGIPACRTARPAGNTKPDMAIPDSLQTAGIVPKTETLNRQHLFRDTILVHLIDRAVKQNPDVLMAMQRIEAMRAQVLVRKGALSPVVAADANVSAQRYGDHTMEGVGNFDTNLSGNIKSSQKAPMPITPNYFIGLRSSWEVDLWGKLKQQERSAYLQLLASEQGKKLVITSLVAEIAERYYTLLSLDAKLAIINANIVLQDSLVSIAKVQKEAGRTTELGVQQFSAQALRSRTMAAEIETDRIRISNEIAYLSGDYPQPVNRAGSFADVQAAIGLPATPATLIENRPDVAEAGLLLQSKGLDLEAARAELRPTLNLAGFLGFNAFKGSMLFHPGSIAYGLVSGLTAPLLNKKAIRGNIARTEAEQQQAIQQYRKAVLKAFSEIQTSVRTIEQLQKTYELNRQETEVLSNAISIANELYKTGYASYLEVITAQKTALEAELNLVETKKTMYASLVELYRAIGGGW